MSAASAMVVTFVGTMYGVAVGGVYAIAQSAGNARLEGGRAARQQQVRYQQHAQQRPPHYD